VRGRLVCGRTTRDIGTGAAPLTSSRSGDQRLGGLLRQHQSHARFDCPAAARRPRACHPARTWSRLWHGMHGVLRRGVCTGLKKW